LFEFGRLLYLDVQRAQQELLNSDTQVVNAQERYEAALDDFKILIGMPVEEPLELTEEEVSLPGFDVEAPVAIDTAIRHRLDLISLRDQVGDSRRGVAIASNGLLPALDLSGSVTLDSDPEHLSSLSYNTERATWRGAASLEIPLDRKEERNAYRSALIGWQQACRAYDLARDRVIADVRQALRRIRQAQLNLRNAELGVTLAKERREAAEYRVQLGKISNRDVVEAELALLNARDRLATARSSLRSTILEFRRDTGTLRIDDNGRWLDLPASDK
jgi:outer membrane protein TolC